MTAAQQLVEAAPDDRAPDKPEPMLDEEQVLALIPISRATLFRLMRDNRFPRGRFISSNRRLWLASEISSWQHAVDERDPHRPRGHGKGRALRAADTG